MKNDSNNSGGPKQPMVADFDLLTPEEAAAYLRVSKSYLDKLRVYGGGPKFLRLGKRKILYRKQNLAVWAAERTFASTSEYDNPAKCGPEHMSNNKIAYPQSTKPRYKY
jgi:excisionase family DNA binding protein